MPGVFITATGTDVGKTFVACALIRALREEGRDVDAFKPVLSGYEGYAGSDAERLLTALGRGEADLDRMSPLRYPAPLAPPSAARMHGETIELPDLVDRCNARLADADYRLLLIEGAGGVMSPIAEGATNLDLMAALGLPVVLVTGAYLGAVSHVLSALSVLHDRGLYICAVVVSETAREPFMMEEMVQALATFAPDHPVVVVPRGEPDRVHALAPLV